MSEITEIKTLNGYPLADTKAREQIASLSAGMIMLDYAAYGLPVLYMTGDTTGMSKDNTVTLAYVYGDKTGTLTCKWQGTSSIAHPKKNYTVKFDNAFEAKEGWGEQSKYCLKANYIDYSHIRNIIGAKLWGRIVRSQSAASDYHSLPNCGAIDGFPCCVVINGEYKGLYSFNIPKDPWMFGFDETDVSQCIISAEKDGDMTRFKIPTAVDGEWFEYEHVAEGANVGALQYNFGKIYTKLSAVKDYNGIYGTGGLASILNMENAIAYYIFCVLLTNRDGIGKNVLYITKDTGNTWRMSAYDMDAVFGNNVNGNGYYIARDHTFKSYRNTSKLFEVIYDYAPKQLCLAYQTLRNWHLTESNVEDYVLNYAVKIPKALLDYETKLWPGIPGTNTNNISQIMDNFRSRVRQLDAEIEALWATLES